MLDVADFGPNPAAPELGRYGVCHVRFGKAMRGSPPRRRAVASVMPWAVEALAQYVGEVRPLHGHGGPGTGAVAHRAGGAHLAPAQWTSASPSGGGRPACPPSCRCTACATAISATS